MLAMLQQHIADLTRDNETLRYLFYGESRLQQAESSLSKVSLQSPDAAADADTDADHEVGHRRDATRDIDLDGLLSRVKEVMRENEELGELLLEAGERGSVQQWERALEGEGRTPGQIDTELTQAESKAVITSLDADLTHHLGVIESLRAELVAVKAQQAGTKYREPESSSSRQDRPRNRESQQRGPGRTGPGDRHKETSRDRDRDKGSRSHVDRPRDSVHHPDARRHGPPTGPRGSTPQRADAGPPPSQTQPQAKQPMQLSVKGRAGSGGGIMSGIAGGVPRGGAQANGAAQAHSRADSTEGDRDSKRRR